MRQSNLELLRIVSILLITFMHAAARIGFFGTPTLQHVSGVNAWLGVIINVVGNTGVTCFVLISGYFGVKYTAKRFIHLVYMVTFYSVLLYFTYQLCDVYRKGDNFMDALLAVPLYHYWFIICYLFLLAVAPYINVFVQQLSKRDFKRLLVVLFIALSLLPTLFSHKNNAIVSDGGKCITYFLFIYLLGRYIRFNESYLRLSSKSLAATLSASLLLTTIIVGVGMLQDGTIINMWTKDFSPLTLLSSVCLFLLFRRLSFQSRTVNYAAKSVLAVYVLNSLYGIVDDKLIHLSYYSYSDLAVVMLVCEVAITFFSCVAIDKLRESLLGRIEDKTISKALELYHRLRHS